MVTSHATLYWKRELGKLRSSDLGWQKLDRQKFLAAGKACKSTFRTTPGFKNWNVVSSWFSGDGTVISAFTGPQHFSKTSDLSNHE